MTASPTLPLKLGALSFTVLWAGWMLWSSGSFDGANMIILAGLGSVAGYVWYRLMRWSFRLMLLLPYDEPAANSGEPS